VKKTFLLFLFFGTLVYGYHYDDLLLKAQASIFPKIMLLDKKLKNKLIDGKIIYTVVYDKNDYRSALNVSDFIDENHKGHFDKYEYQVNLVEFTDLSDETQASAIYALNSNQYIEKVAEIAKKKGIIAFAYDISNLKNGFLFSLMLEKSAVLYLNKENLYTQQVDFVESLFQIVKFLNANGR